MKNNGRRGKKHYDKISMMVKKQFIAKVLGENITIKEASKIFKINYSTAKTIIRLHKIKNGHIGDTWDHVLSKPCIDSETDANGGIAKEALFREINNDQITKMEKRFCLYPYTCLITDFQKSYTTINGLSS